MSSEPSTLPRLFQILSPRGWLAVAVVSLALAALSSFTLLSNLSEGAKDRLVLGWESVLRFGKDTWRLTTGSGRRAGGAADDAANDASSVAPRALLDPDAEFVWVTRYDDTVPLGDEVVDVPPVAPRELLDPAWSGNPPPPPEHNA